MIFFFFVSFSSVFKTHLKLLALKLMSFLLTKLQKRNSTFCSFMSKRTGHVFVFGHVDVIKDMILDRSHIC